jgi:hypothetical protein
MTLRDLPHLNRHLERLNALYARFGIHGLKHCSSADVLLLMAAKELELNEFTKRSSGTGADEQDIAHQHALQLEIQDLSMFHDERNGRPPRALNSPRQDRGMER